MTTQSLTQKQLELLIQLYRYTYLDRTQIQQLLKHSKHNRIQTWLNNLTIQNLITKHYKKTIQSIPAIYSLTADGKQLIRQQYKDKGKKITFGKYVTDDKKIEQTRNHCIQVAKVCLSLLAQSGANNDKITITSRAELKSIRNLLSPHPDAYVVVTKSSGEVRRYFLEVFADIPTTRIRARVRKYLDYYESGQWQDNTDKPFPTIAFVFPNVRLRSHIGHFLKAKLSDDSELQTIIVCQDNILPITSIEH